MPRKAGAAALLQRFARGATVATSDRSWSAGDLAPNNRQPPALLGRPQPRASSRRQLSPQSVTEMPVVTHIYRYPIKGLSAQPLSRVVVETGRPFPADRMLALARPNTPIDPRAPKWAKKGMFVMLMLEEVLAQVKTHLDVEIDAVHRQSRQSRDPHRQSRRRGRLRQGGGILPSAGADAACGTPPRALARRPFHGQARQRALAHQSRDGAQPERAMGLRDQSAAVPREFLHRRRPAVGGVRLDRRQCAPGRRDLPGRSPQRPVRRDQRQSRYRPPRPRHSRLAPRRVRPQGSRRLPRHLRGRRGGGRRRRRDAAHQRAIERPVAARPAINGHRRFMCRGCYYIYEEANGLPQQSIPAGTSFADIPSAWRCPDCGTEKTTFRPYVDNPDKAGLRTRP